MENEYSWEKFPKTDDRVIKLFRNFCSDEFNCELVYENECFYKDWEVDVIINFVKENGSKKHLENLLNLYESNLEKAFVLPFASAIHQFMRKYDSIWFEEVYLRNYDISKQNL